MEEILFIMNDPPYGSEKIFNALRLVLAIAKKQEGKTIRIFLLGDSVIAAKKSQNVTQGFCDILPPVNGVGFPCNCRVC